MVLYKKVSVSPADKWSVTQCEQGLIIFEGARVGGGRHVTHSSHNSTYVLVLFIYLFVYLLIYFSFLFETFPNTISWNMNILILTFIDYVSLSIVGDGQSSLIM